MIRPLIAADIPGLDSLPPKAWHYDYEAFLSNYIGEDYFHAFVIVQNEVIVGTGNVFVSGKIGWLANIIVSEECRGSGLGSKMTEHLVEFLNNNGCETQLLIATELGESVYRKIGFKKIADYQCFDSEIDQDFTFTDAIRDLEDANLEEVYQLDQEANDEDRVHLIDKYYKTGIGYFNKENELTGFYLPDFGRGLIISKDKQAGQGLLKLKHSKKGRRTLIPIENKDGIDFLEQYGMRKGERSSRMVLGKVNDWRPEFIYSYGSGYCG